MSDFVTILRYDGYTVRVSSFLRRWCRGASVMPDYDFIAAFDRIRQVAGVTTQTGLAAFLGVSQASIWDAKRRAEGIPAGWLVTLVEKYGLNPTWVKTGQGTQRLSLPLEDIPLEDVIAEVVRRGKVRLQETAPR